MSDQRNFLNSSEEDTTEMDAVLEEQAAMEELKAQALAFVRATDEIMKPAEAEQAQAG